MAEFHTLAETFAYLQTDRYLVTDQAWRKTQDKAKNIIQDKHDKYQAGDRAIWKDGIHEKMPNGKWKKIEGMSKPLVITNKYGTFHFNINKKDFQKNKHKLQKNIVARIQSGLFTSKTGKEAKEKAKKWLQQKVGSEIKTEIGTVIINGNCLDDSFGHGKYPVKYDAVQAIKPILERGVYLGEMDDLEGNDLNDYYFTSKVQIDGKEKYVFCRIRESRSGQTGKRFYLHSVYTEDDIKDYGKEEKNRGAQNKAAPVYKKQNDSGAPLELRLIQNYLNCK